jgi:hypothetical protein
MKLIKILLIALTLGILLPSCLHLDADDRIEHITTR